MNSSINSAFDRTEEYLKLCECSDPAEILADLIHYCNVKNMDFERVLEVANKFVAAETN